MTRSVKILEATEADVETLVSIFVEAMEPDLSIRFMFSDRRQEAIEKQTAFALPNIRRRFTHPANKCHSIKAVKPDTDEILGWSLLRWEDGAPLKAPEIPPGQDVTFLMWYWTELDKKYRKITQGYPHVVLGSLYVRPSAQRQGIGTKLLEWAFDRYNLSDEKVFVQTVMNSEGFYEKFGWEQVGYKDIDLSEWGGKNKGFGILRSPQLLRQSGLLKIRG